MMRRSTFCCLFVLAFSGLVQASAADLSLLFLGDDGHHQPAFRARQLIPAMANRGIEVTYTNDLADLNAKTLAAYDGLIVYANHEKISPEQEKALLDYVADGHGFVPLHCASYCFLNSDKYIELVGAQFKSHTTGTFRVKDVAPKHPIMQGYGGFESWDETYVHHRHNEIDRTILETRAEGERDEPWTWVRTHGKGRVFYTAWGHDHRTWGHPGFQNLVERGIRWACGSDDLSGVPVYRERPAFVSPEMTPPRKDVKPFEYVDVGPKIPNYQPGRSLEKPHTMMQKPLSPEESLKHYVTPKGFHLELFADERNFAGKPIGMNWDERGRLWICETVDYPNELQPQGKGRDRIRICEDTDGDWKADKFTVFAENLSIPTAIAFYRGGAIVQDGTRTLYLKDTDGDDVADVRTILIKGWALGDTHGGVSNFRYGLDNWFWGMQGYNNSAPEYNLAADGSTTKESKKSTPFRMGFFRFKLDNNDPPKVTDLEFVRSTNNNTWGLGFSEEGLVFGSTANRNPSVYMPIANRYYERVRGWAPQGLGTIADTHKFDPITDKVRQVDHHGGYTAGAGHALYTARRYPRQYWNRTAFVCGPTGHLVGTFVLKPNGADFTSSSPCNLIASDDEWSAPIAAEVGPDGNVWVLDWYNYIVQHNPTPHGFKNGRGNAYESDLRDRKHGRIYRVVYDDEIKPISLAGASADQLVAALKSDNMLWRLHAQRLLVERGEQDVVAKLATIVQDQAVDAISGNSSIVNALWTLQGLNATQQVDSPGGKALKQALTHPSDAVRQSAAATLPTTRDWSNTLLNASAQRAASSQVRQAALLKIADISPYEGESCGREGILLVDTILDPTTYHDRWLLDAATSAAAQHDRIFLGSIAIQGRTAPDPVLSRVSIVAQHFARGRPEAASVSEILFAARTADSKVVEAMLNGMATGWQKDHDIKLKKDDDKAIAELLVTLPAESKAKLIQLASAWGSESISEHTEAIAKSLLEAVGDEKKSADARIGAAKQLVGLRTDDGKIVDKLLREISPQASPELAAGLLEACQLSRAEGIGDAIVDQMEVWTPAVKASAIRVLLSRPELTESLLSGIEDGQLQMADLSLDQKQALANHLNKEVAARAKKLLERGGGLPNPDRQKVLAELMPLTEQSGDVALGKVVFNKQCSKCHTHSGEGTQIGPDLTGMAVHPKKELLGHIIDPSASVEGNFRTYTIYTLEGRVHTGMLAGESKTAVELIDAEAKRHTILREDIDELIASPKSLMPEGFEKQIAKAEMVNLLEFLTARGKYLPLDLSKAATIVSTQGMFFNKDADVERLIFPDWKSKTFEGVPFVLVDPQGDSKPNVIMLNGPEGKFPPQMPKSVTLACGAPAKAIHFLSGVSGWGYPYAQEKTVTMIVRLHYEDGKTEDHELRNGVHFADYIRKVDVPKSKLAFMLRNQQIRYLAVHPQRAAVIENIELVKGPDRTAPVVMAVTVEAGEE